MTGLKDEHDLCPCLRYGLLTAKSNGEVEADPVSIQRGKLDLLRGKDTLRQMKSQPPDPATLGEIIEMALSDHASFDQIRALHGFGPDEVKALMQQNLKSGSYRAWRRRVRAFADRREVYK